jgi:hypothetical protein
MELAISGKFSKDVFDEAYDLVWALRDSLDLDKLKSVQTELNLFLYFPVILNDNLEVKKKSLRRYSKSERSETVNSEIPIDQWVRATRAERLDLLVDDLERSIVGTNSMKIPEASKVIICAELRRARDKVI